MLYMKQNKIKTLKVILKINLIITIIIFIIMLDIALNPNPFIDRYSEKEIALDQTYYKFDYLQNNTDFSYQINVIGNEGPNLKSNTIKLEMEYLIDFTLTELFFINDYNRIWEEINYL